MELWLKIVLIVAAVVIGLVLLSYISKAIVRIYFACYVVAYLTYKFIKFASIVCVLVFGYFFLFKDKFELYLMISFGVYFGIYFLESIVFYIKEAFDKN